MKKQRAQAVKFSPEMRPDQAARKQTNITLGLLQHACGTNPDANLKKALAMAERAAKQGANIICTQELFRSQYFCQAENHDYFKPAEAVPNGPSTKAFQVLS